MTPLPAALGGAGLVAWRLDEKRFAAIWDSGEGARLHGGRWNSRGRKTVYCSIDPATAILEVAANKGLRTLDVVPHVLTSADVVDPAAVHVVQPSAVPNTDWLRPGIPTTAQQEFGDSLLSAHSFVLIPSTVSTHSWNLLFDVDVAKRLYSLQRQEDFVLDPRLHRPVSP